MKRLFLSHIVVDLLSSTGIIYTWDFISFYWRISYFFGLSQTVLVAFFLLSYMDIFTYLWQTFLICLSFCCCIFTLISDLQVTISFIFAREVILHFRTLLHTSAAFFIFSLVCAVYYTVYASCFTTFYLLSFITSSATLFHTYFFWVHRLRLCDWPQPHDITPAYLCGSC